nr:cupin domain-containing protein [bacterium]
MSDSVRQIGQRIQELREIFEYTPEEIANEFQLPLETYLGYECGESDIPIGFLYELANKYHVELTVLLTGDNPKLSRFALSRNNGGIEVRRREEYHYRSLAFNFHNKQIEPLYVRINPDDPALPIALNSHPGQEWDYILSGHLRLQLDDRVFDMRKGDSIYFDSSVMHGMKAIDGDVEFLAIILETEPTEKE